MISRVVLCALLLLPMFAAPARSQQTATRRQQARQHLLAAQQHLKEQRPDLAIPELQKVVALEPGNVDARANLGVLLYFRADYAGAIPELRAAVKAKPDLWKIQALLGLAEGRQHDDVASRTDLETAFPHLEEEKLKEQVGATLVNDYAAAGDLDKAASTAAAMLQAQPTNAPLLFTTYQLYADLADKAMLSLALSAPESAQMHQVMARELARHGDTAQAIVNYREALRLNPQSPGVHFELGNLLYNSTDDKQKAEAEGEFQAALADDPQYEKAALMLGAIAAKRGDWKTASEYDARALGLQPDDADACLEMAKVLIATNEREKAKHLLERAIELEPTDSVAHYRLSTLYRQDGNQERAAQELAAYHKYKDMKDKLEKVFHDMRVDTKQKSPDDADAPR